MRQAGFEPARGLSLEKGHHQIPNLERLPIPPLPRALLLEQFHYIRIQRFFIGTEIFWRLLRTRFVC